MLNYLTAIVLLLLVGRGLGMLFRYLGFQTLIGEVLAGVILGPLCLRLIDPVSTPEISVFADMGIIMLMLLAGLMTNYRAFTKTVRTSSFVGGVGVAVSFLLVYFPLVSVGLNFQAALFIAAILSNTAIEVCARILIDQSGTRLGSVVIGASFIDDIIAVFIIAVVTSQVGMGTDQLTLIGIQFTVDNILLKLLIIAMVVTAFILLSLIGVTKLIERIFDHIYRRAHGEKILLTATLLITFTFAVVARQIGLHEVIGAYIAGLIIGRWGTKVRPMLKRRIAWQKLVDDIDPQMRAIFGPLFFGYIGMLFTISTIGQPTALVLLFVFMLGLALAGKILGCGLSARFSRFDTRESFIIGCAMCGRGALGLVLARFGVELGILEQIHFNALVLTVLATVIVTPMLYTYSLRGTEPG